MFKTLELTTGDLLRKLERPSPKLEEPKVLSPEELTAPGGLAGRGARPPPRAPRSRAATTGTQRAGLDAHRFHGLRHDFASLLLAAGVADRVVMEMMGHSTIAMTANRYQHVPDELQHLAADRLDALLSIGG